MCATVHEPAARAEVTFLTSLRQRVAQQQPSLLALFETLAGEATFARDWLQPELARLVPGARILEVGGGAFLLSCLLAQEGFSVTSIEPVGDGFGEFPELAKIVLEYASAKPTIAACRGEDFVGEAPFDFAFSVNVMEHVADVDAVIGRVAAALKPGARYRFFCPNYLFPYEPHFNIPIVFTKDITQFLLHQRIHTAPMHDPAGAWHSLNWITVPKVRAVAVKHQLDVHFDTDFFASQLERATRDELFAARRGKAITSAARLFTGLQLHKLISSLPALVQPTMDVTLTKRSAA